MMLSISPFIAAPAAAGDRPPEAFGEVTFEMPEGGAYAQEMITMVVRFYFKARATTEWLEQPDLDELGWTQLGRDNWAPTKIKNVNWFGFERRIAIFAPETKSYTIPPFVHHLTLIDADDRRWTVDARSKPVDLAITRWPGKIDGPDDESTWWLPARLVEISDSWSVDPATLAAGETSRRRVEVTAVGTLAEQLPPMIETQSPGLVVFPGPVERRTEIVNGVPIAHAIYSYDVRPHTGDPTILKEVLLPWFDTQSRAMRQAVVPGASVGQGMVIPGQPLSDEAGEGGMSRLAVGLGAALAAFVAGLALLLAPSREDRLPVYARLVSGAAEMRRTLAVRKAAWLGRPEEMRGAIYRLARDDGAAGSPPWLASGEARDALAALDAALFGPRGGKATGGVDPAALKRLSRHILAERAHVLSPGAKVSGAPAYDGLTPFGPESRVN